MTITDEQKKLLTEEVLGECWHDGTSILMAGYHCKKCDKIFSCNRTFDNRNDLMDLYEAIYRDGKFAEFENSLIDYWDKDFKYPNIIGIVTTAWLFCLDGKGYEEHCKIVAEFYGWEE